MKIATEPMKFIRDRGSEGLLLLLLSTDGLFMVLHLFVLLHAFTGLFTDHNHLFFLLHSFTGLFTGGNYNITVDGSFAEVFMYVEEYWLILMLLFLAFRKFTFCYLAWALLFGYLLVDDCFQIHEGLGIGLTSYFTLPAIFGLSPQDLGELMVSASVGSILLGAIGLSTYFADQKERRFSRDVFLLLLALVFFGVIVDIIHAVVHDLGWKHIVGYILGFVEDGGEMVVMSVMTWFVYTATTNRMRCTKEDRVEPCHEQITHDIDGPAIT